MSKQKRDLRRTKKARNGAPLVLARHVIGEFAIGDDVYHEVHVIANPLGGEVTLRSTAQPHKTPVTAWYHCDQWSRMYSDREINEFVDSVVATPRKGEVPRNMRFAPTTAGVLV